LVYDVSNACLGMLNGMLQVAALIELGQVRAGLVVGTEDSRALVETTIAHLNRDDSINRGRLKPAMASLTIGSGSAAALLVDQSLARQGLRLAASAALARTEFESLCQGGPHDAVGPGTEPLMSTEAEALLHAGIASAAPCFRALLAEAGWLDTRRLKTFCHQVGAAHRRALLEGLSLRSEADFSTYEFLGNTGSVALPVTTAIGIERGHVSPGDRVALLGIGSGINVIMLALEALVPASRFEPGTDFDRGRDVAR
jgi:3-oxoacyl-[acyl-carrier-protein] synthase-3